MRPRSVIGTGFVVTTLLISGCNQTSNSPAATAPTVDVAAVDIEQITSWDRFNGRVVSIDAVTILPRVGGHITQVAYQEGSEVKKGDLLFVIDQRPYFAALDNARARLERARASLVFARRRISERDNFSRTTPCPGKRLTRSVAVMIRLWPNYMKQSLR